MNDENAERDALVRAAESQKKEQIAYAGEIIAMLQDAVDLDMATEEEKLSLTHWKNTVCYLIAFSRKMLRI